MIEWKGSLSLVCAFPDAGCLVDLQGCHSGRRGPSSCPESATGEVLLSNTSSSLTFFLPWFSPEWVEFEGSSTQATMATFLVSNQQELEDALATSSLNNQKNTIVLDATFGDQTLTDGPLVYSGDTTLSIIGNGSTITQSDPQADVFVANGGGDVSIANLSIEGGYRGIGIDVPADETGTVTVTLTDVDVSGTFYHGVHVDDQTNGSAASVVLNLNNSVIDGNGAVGDNSDGLGVGDSISDSDGVRVDEGGAGNATVNISSSVITNNGADGLEIDERGSGSVFLAVSDSNFEGNGFWDSEDVDDGIDVDEADAGSIQVAIESTTISNNFDEGLDLDEAGSGDVSVEAQGVTLSGNGDEGLKVTEEDGGDVSAALEGLLVEDNGEEGIMLEEFGDGSVEAGIVISVVGRNGKEGVDIEEEGLGDVRFGADGLTAIDNSDEGIEVTEDGEGDLITGLRSIVAAGNGNSGIFLEQLGGGTLRARGRDILTENNGEDGIRLFSGGPIVPSNGVETGGLYAAFRSFSSNGNAGVSINVEEGAGSLTLRDASFSGNFVDNDPTFPSTVTVAMINTFIDTTV